MEMGSGPLLLVIIAVSGIGVVGAVVWIWALIDCISKEPKEGNDRIVWVIVIALTGCVGALIYLLWRRPQRVARTGR